MKEFKLFLLVIASSLLSILVHAQGATLLKTEQGVSLSYTREFYKKCKEITNREYNIYKITVYLSNNSGKSIKMADSWVSNKNPNYLNCISQYDNFGSMTIKPSGDLNASPEWDTRGKPWPSNSTLKGTYYIAVPIEDGEPPKPDWAMGGFAFVDDKKTNQAQPQWSEWKTDDCFSGLKYRVLGKEIYDLNRQYHYYFEFINEYKEAIFFDFNLLDKNGKIRFGDRHTIQPGRNLAFNHKMTDNYIVSFSTEKVCFKLDDKNYSPCLTPEEDKDKKNADLTQKPVEEKKQDSKPEPSNTKPPIFMAENIAPSIEGDWLYETTSNVKKIWKIELTADGLKTTYQGSIQSFIFKKEGDQYVYKSGSIVGTIKFMSDTRFKYSFTNLTNSSYNYEDYYSRSNLSSDNTKENSSNNNNDKISEAYDGKWESEDKSVILTVSTDNEGVNIRAYYPEDKSSSAITLFKKISPNTFMYEKTGTILKFTDKDLKWISGKTGETFLYHRYLETSTKEETEAKKVASGLFNLMKNSPVEAIWNGDNGRSGTMVMASNSFTWTNQGESNGYLFKKTGTDTYRFDDGGNYCVVKFLSDTKLDYSCNGSHYAYFNRSSPTVEQNKNSSVGKASGKDCPENGKWVKPNSGGAFFINIECKGDELSIKLYSGQTVIATKLSYSNPMFPGKTLWQCTWPTMEGGHKDELCTMVRGEDNVISIYWGLTNNNADWRMDFMRAL